MEKRSKKWTGSNTWDPHKPKTEHQKGRKYQTISASALRHDTLASTMAKTKQSVFQQRLNSANHFSCRESWMLTTGLERRIQDFEKCYRRIKQANMPSNRSRSPPDVRSVYCQPTCVASYHCSAMSIVMIRCQRSCYKEQWMAGVAEEDTEIMEGQHQGIRNGQASHCCLSRMPEVDGQSSQQRHLLKYPNDAWASWVLVS